ncbi:platelet-activating factor acetylhydrolase IB subunit beta isoform X2 [Lates calcarifer]|uniref:Platelet-activating factor acetylhydrolase IB subunit alpha2 n=1 Tax=Lates calcarifer TaxID=8187 RepID=A0AAJ8DWR7_LATCA|nr:platelet-activating factor acetylhydrolase IB subunit beta isoform X2 [Lates calcarifer]
MVEQFKRTLTERDMILIHQLMQHTFALRREEILLKLYKKTGSFGQEQHQCNKNSSPGWPSIVLKGGFIRCLENLQVLFKTLRTTSPFLPRTSGLLRTWKMMSGDELNPAAVPQPAEDVQGDGRWMSQHTRFVQECKDGEPDVLFVGDSMVQLMQQYEVWRELFSPLHALNFGIGGDTTCNVLWRLQNGELENIRPKVVVLWVGTNNYEHTAEQVAGGILAIAQLLTSRLPKAKIVVLGLLPRGERPNPLREKNAAVNGLLRSWLPRLGQAQLLDLGGEFVHSDGTIISQDMFDFLHLTSTGYRTVAKPLSDLLLQILDETPEERRASLV